MSEKEEERKFQLEMLEISLKHEREVTYYTAKMAIGQTDLVFGVTVSLAALVFLVSEHYLPLQLGAFAVGVVYAIIAISGIRTYSNYEKKINKEVKDSEKTDLDSIRQQFTNKSRTETEEEKGK